MVTCLTQVFFRSLWDLHHSRKKTQLFSQLASLAAPVRVWKPHALKGAHTSSFLLIMVLVVLLPLDVLTWIPQFDRKPLGFYICVFMLWSKKLNCNTNLYFQLLIGSRFYCFSLGGCCRPLLVVMLCLLCVAVRQCHGFCEMLVLTTAWYHSIPILYCTYFMSNEIFKLPRS